MYINILVSFYVMKTLWALCFFSTACAVSVIYRNGLVLKVCATKKKRNKKRKKLGNEHT